MNYYFIIKVSKDEMDKTQIGITTFNNPRSG